MGRRLVDDFKVVIGKPGVTRVLVAAVVTFKERVSARQDIIVLIGNQVE